MKWRYWPETLIAVLVVILDVPGRTPHTTAAEASAGWTTQKKFDARCGVIQNACNCSFLIQVLAKGRVSYGITALTTTCLMVRLFTLREFNILDLANISAVAFPLDEVKYIIITCDQQFIPALADPIVMFWKGS
jgi:hypothetical protein